MKLFTIWCRSHGQFFVCFFSVKEFHRIEQLEHKQARFHNHLRFTLRCRDEGSVPTSLGIKNPIPMIVRKARNTLVRERIRCTVNKINNIEEQLAVKRSGFKQLFPLEKETERKINEHLKHVHEQEFQTAKTLQKTWEADLSQKRRSAHKHRREMGM